MLHGRREELSAIDQLLEDMRSGRAGALVLRGEAGIGKTALLDAAAGRAAGAQILRTAGVECEEDLPFAGLHALLRPVLDQIEVLPRIQATALRGAFGMGEPTGADRFGIGLGLLSFITELSEDRPVLCLVDDVQWLDGASVDALLFAARRLEAERAAFIFAARDESHRVSLPGLAELRLGGLDRATAGRLLAEAGLAPPIREQLIAEAAGNPLALIELSRGLSAAERSGSLTPLTISVASPAARVQAAFTAQIAVLPESCRRAVLVAALDGSPSLAEVSRAITAAGGSVTDLAAAERAGLVRVTQEAILFSHPLVRASVKAGSDVGMRMAAHRALAEVLEGDGRAWHRAALATGPDEQVAAELDGAAQRAGERGSPAAMSVAYAQAAVLSAEPSAKGRRLILAAESAADAGLLARAEALSRQAGLLVTEPELVAQLARVTAQLLFETDRPVEAASILLDGAASLAPADAATARAMAGQAVLYLWRSIAGPSRQDLERRALALLPPAEIGLFEFLRAIRRLQDPDPATPAILPTRPDRATPHLLGSSPLAFDLVHGDLPAARSRAVRFAADCRGAGNISQLAHALGYLARAQILYGEYQDARMSVEEAMRIAADTGQGGLAGRLAVVAAEIAAVTGDEQECVARAAQAREQSAGVWTTSMAGADCALARLDLGLGRYHSALERLQAAMSGPSRHAHLLLYSHPDHVEAALRAGRPELATGPLIRFTTWADAISQPWAKAVASRCAALTTADADPEPLYRRALAAHDGDGRPFEQARTHLAYGEWLRRSRRRASSRDHLLAAADIFARLSARPWLDRAQAELRAMGEVPPAIPADDPLARLTAQELQVVRLAATGASNKQIGAQLFLSPRTVGYHLYKAFPKLGVTSREELARYAPLT